MARNALTTVDGYNVLGDLLWCSHRSHHRTDRPDSNPERTHIGNLERRLDLPVEAVEFTRQTASAMFDGTADPAESGFPPPLLPAESSSSFGALLFIACLVEKCQPLVSDTPNALLRPTQLGVRGEKLEGV